ncbi:MAG: hypothetical protein R3B09_18440 [Nannocystaceae bacterium]
MPAGDPSRRRATEPRPEEGPSSARLRGAALLVALACGLGLVGCASRAPSTIAAGEARWAGPQDAPTEAPADVVAGADGELEEAREVDEDHDGTPDLELDLAEYERLLVQQELRLQSAGVVVAVGDARVTGSTEADSNAQLGAGSGRAAGGGGSVGGGVSSPSTSPRPATRPSAPSPSGVSTKHKSTSPTKTAKRTPTAKAPAADASYARDGDACLEVCDLAASTCDLEQRICDLASRHPGEPRYQQVCARAHEDCRVATQACESCAV